LKEPQVPKVPETQSIVPTPSDAGHVIHNSLNYTYQKSTQNDPGGWLYSPARLQIFTMSDQDLTTVSELRGRTVKRVHKVRASMVAGGKTVWIYPAEDEDVDGITVSRSSSAVWINLVSLLGPAKLTVRPGSRELYPMTIDRQSPVGPALALDLTRMLERRNKKEKAESQTTAQTPAPAKKDQQPG